jgi:predicted transcriptional regulator
MNTLKKRGRSHALSAIDEILDLLEDGKWHGIKEAMVKSDLQEFKVEMIYGFLAEYAFIDFNKEQQKAKLTPVTLEFLREIRRINKKSALNS